MMTQAKEEMETRKRKVFEEVKKMTESLPLGRCLYASLLALIAIRKEFPDVVIQAGSFSWPIVPPEQDDGISPTHFSYVWSPQDYASYQAMLQGRMPEMHVWAVIRSTQEVVDLSTYELPEQCKKVAKLEWKTARPPDFLWCTVKDIPEGVQYKADRMATMLALQYCARLLSSGFVSELMKGNPSYVYLVK